jgi:hypothetical protein
MSATKFFKISKETERAGKLIIIFSVYMTSTPISILTLSLSTMYTSAVIY